MQSTLSILAFALMVAGIAGCYYSGALFVSSPVVIALQLFGVMLMLWARVTFGRRSFHAAAQPTAGGVVKTGPYRYVRHPIYTAAQFFVWPPAVFRATAPAFAFAMLVTIGAIARMLCEEYLLVQQYPNYVEYAKSTKRMIPFLF